MQRNITQHKFLQERFVSYLTDTPSCRHLVTLNKPLCLHLQVLVGATTSELLLGQPVFMDTYFQT